MVKTESKKVKKEKIKKIKSEEQKKFKPWMFTLVLVILLGFIVSYYRAMPYDLKSLDNSVTSSIDEWSKTLIESEVNNMDISPLQKVSLKDEMYKDYLKDKSISLSQGELKRSEMIDYQSNILKDQFKINDTPYLLAIDPYYYARQAKEDIQKGYFATENSDGTYHDDLRLAPNGVDNAKVDIHAKVMKFFYNLFYSGQEFSDANFFKAIYFIPLILSLLTIIGFFFFLKGYMDDIIAFFCSIILGLSPTFLQRTVAGFVDTDPYNVLFPILIVLAISISILKKQKAIKYSFAAIAGVLQILFFKIWSPGIFSYIVVLLSLFVYIIAQLILKLRKKENDLKGSLIIFVIYNLTIVFLSLIFGLTFFKSILYLGASTGLQNAVSDGIWPNIFTSVAELQSANYSNIYSQLAQNKFLLLFLSFVGPMLYLAHITKRKVLGLKTKKQKTNLIIFLAIIFWYFLFSLSMIGIKIPIINSIYNLSLINTTLLQILFIIIFYAPYIYLFFEYILKTKKYNKELFIFLLALIWYPITQFMVLKGVRFLLFTATPFALSIGLSFVFLFDLLKKGLNAVDMKHILWSKVAIVIILLMMVWGFFGYANQVGMSAIPNMNDAWYNTLDSINEDSETSIITSWWDFGHFFIYFSQRGVTFDGASQNGPQAHWVGRLLKAKTENESMGILRMLDCSGNNAYDFLNEIRNDPIINIKLIESLVGLNNKTQIEEYMNDNTKLKSDEIKKISDLIYCENPPEAYIIASEDMIGKSGVWAKWGSWDFDKAYIYKNRKNLTKEDIVNKLGYDESDASKLLLEARSLKSETEANSWIAPIISYGIEGQCQEQENKLICSNNIIMDQENQIPYMVIDQGCSERESSYYCQQKSYKKDNRILFNGYLLDELYSVVGFSNNTLSENIYNVNSDYSVLFFQSDTGVESLFMSKELSTSLFTKMFYLQGQGLENFEHFNVQMGSGSGTIYTYKVKW